MYLYEDSQDREERVTKLLVKDHYEILLEKANVTAPAIICVQFDKRRFDKEGDVDIVVCKLKDSSPIVPDNIEKMIAFEVKASWIDNDGVFHSLKKGKKRKEIEQFKQLDSESWDEIYQLDFVVTKPNENLLNSITTQVFERYDKTVSMPNCGHILIVKTSLNGRYEEYTGGFLGKTLRQPQKRELTPNHHDVKRSFCNMTDSLGVKTIKTICVVFDTDVEKNKINLPVWIHNEEGILILWNNQAQTT